MANEVRLDLKTYNELHRKATMMENLVTLKRARWNEDRVEVVIDLTPLVPQLEDSLIENFPDFEMYDNHTNGFRVEYTFAERKSQEE